MPRQDLIDIKLNRVITPMINDLIKNEKVFARIGGHIVINKEEEVKFQIERKQNLEWAKTATDEEIKQKIESLESELTLEELACKYGIVKDLSFETIKKISLIEDLELALGVHPAIKGGNS